MIRMLIVGYCYGTRSERMWCQEVELHLAYRWFCKLYLGDKVPHHSGCQPLNHPVASQPLAPFDTSYHLSRSRKPNAIPSHRWSPTAMASACATTPCEPKISDPMLFLPPSSIST
jgi:hypothetical protein